MKIAQNGKSSIIPFISLEILLKLNFWADFVFYHLIEDNDEIKN